MGLARQGHERSMLLGHLLAAAATAHRASCSPARRLHGLLLGGELCLLLHRDLLQILLLHGELRVLLHEGILLFLLNVPSGPVRGRIDCLKFLWRAWPKGNRTISIRFQDSQATAKNFKSGGPYSSSVRSRKQAAHSRNVSGVSLCRPYAPSP